MKGIGSTRIFRHKALGGSFSEREKYGKLFEPPARKRRHDYCAPWPASPQNGVNMDHGTIRRAAIITPARYRGCTPLLTDKSLLRLPITGYFALSRR
jgi:hypothetical protein